jgi:hypothetical protein
MSTGEGDWNVPNGSGLGWSLLGIFKKLQKRSWTPSECCKGAEIAVLLLKGWHVLLKSSESQLSVIIGQVGLEESCCIAGNPNSTSHTMWENDV